MGSYRQLGYSLAMRWSMVSLKTQTMVDLLILTINVTIAKTLLLKKKARAV